MKFSWNVLDDVFNMLPNLHIHQSILKSWIQNGKRTGSRVKDAPSFVARFRPSVAHCLRGKTGRLVPATFSIFRPHTRESPWIGGRGDTHAGGALWWRGTAASNGPNHRRRRRRRRQVPRHWRVITWHAAQLPPTPAATGRQRAMKRSPGHRVNETFGIVLQSFPLITRRLMVARNQKPRLSSK